MQGYIWILDTDRGGVIVAASGDTLDEARESVLHEFPAVYRNEPLFTRDFESNITEDEVEQELKAATMSLMEQLESFGAAVTGMSDNLKN